MAEILNRSATEFAAGRKVLSDTVGAPTAVTVEMPAAWTAASGDTVATGLIVPKGCRVRSPVTVSNATGTASQTLHVGLRNNLTKAVVDATGIVNAAAITTAGTAVVLTGTKTTLGQRYVTVEDCEVYMTLNAATPTANQAIRVTFEYVGA